MPNSGKHRQRLARWRSCSLHLHPSRVSFYFRADRSPPMPHGGLASWLGACGRHRIRFPTPDQAHPHAPKPRMGATKGFHRAPPRYSPGDAFRRQPLAFGPETWINAPVHCPRRGELLAPAKMGKTRVAPSALAEVAPIIVNMRAFENMDLERPRWRRLQKQII